MPARSYGLLVFGALSLLSDIAAAQSQYQRQVREHLADASDILLERGYREQETYSSALPDGDEHMVDISLRFGQTYAILAVCDEDCSDIDLYLYDEHGNPLDSDVASDAVPVVDVVPAHSGDYRVKVKMYNCAAEPCFYALGVYRIATSSATGRGNGGRYAGEVRRALRGAYDDILADRGYQPTDDEFDGALLDDEQDAIWLRLRRGESYAILGACDAECTDLDLYLYDENDEEVESDVAPDARPVLEFRPRRSGDYRVRISMYSCTAEPCEYGVNVYKR